MKIPLFVFVVALGAVSCGPSKKAASADPGSASWQRMPLTIDGSDKDWTRPLLYASSSEKINYSVTNDDQFLYILLETKSPQEQQKIIQGGMTVWVNTKSDKSEAGAVGIGYPLDSRIDHDRQLMQEAQPERYQSKKPVTLEDKKTYSLYGFVKDSTGSYDYADDGNPQGVKVRMDYSNDGVLIYEAAVPLATLYPNHHAGSSYAANSVAVGIFVEGLPPDANVPRGGGGGPDIGVGGGIGFGSFGSGGGIGISIGSGGLLGGGGGRKQLFRSTQTWQVVQLSNARAAGSRPF